MVNRAGAEGVTVRTADAKDIERLIEIHRNAFPDVRGGEARRVNFTTNPLGSFANLFVAERAGTVVAHAFLFPFEVWVGRRRVRAGGIASVGVASEARGTGVARVLLESLHATSHARGDAFTYLYAFRQSFYLAHGYAPASSFRRLVATPRAIPAAWVEDARRAGLRSATGDDAPGILAAYVRAASRSNGFLVRPAALWERRFVDERRNWFVLGGGADVRGYVSWTLAQDEAHAAIRMNISDLVADDEAQRRVLLGLVGLQRDQVATFSLTVDATDPIERALVDLDAHRHGDASVEHTLGEIVGGPLVRIQDPVRAIGARGWNADGSTVLDVEGARWRVVVEHGTARALSTTDAPDVTVDRPTLSALLFGGLLPSEAARIGALVSADAASLARSEALLTAAPFFTLDAF